MRKSTKLMRVLILTLAAVVCLGMLFTSCGDDETITPTPGTTATTTAPTTGSSNDTTDTSGDTTDTSGDTTDTSGDTTDTSGDTTDTSGDTTDTSGDTTDTSGDTTDTSGDTTDTSGDTTDTSGDTTDTSGDTTDTSGDTTDTSGGTTDTSDKPGTDDEPCTHIWKAATCVVPETCRLCGETRGEADGDHVGGTATCEELACCELCGTEYGELGSHDWADATCTTPKTCNYCLKEEGEALGHIGGNATCSSRPVCERCHSGYGTPSDHTYYTEADAQEGVHFDYNPAPTCTEAGVMAYKCTECGKLATKQEYLITVDPIAHDMLAATCTSPSKCKDCGKEEGEPAAHDTNPATCDLPISCKNCNYTEGDPLGHAYNTEDANYCVIVNSTCIKEGKKAYVCTRCAQEAKEGSEYYTVIPTVEHNYVEEEAYFLTAAASTCVDRGYNEYKCCVDADCTASKKFETDEALKEHVYDVELEPVAPTCSEEGYTPFACSAGNCGTERRENYVDRIAHTFTAHVVLGDFDVITCSVCQESFVNDKTIINKSVQNLCLGNCETAEDGTCQCGVSVEWTGYTKPSAPDALVANEAYVKDSVKAGGLIKLVCDEEATFTVVIDGIEGQLVLMGSEIIIDLYKLDADASVTITSTLDATVVFYNVF